MKQNIKKLISLFLVLAMLFAISVPALAVDSRQVKKPIAKTIINDSVTYVDMSGTLNTIYITIDQNKKIVTTKYDNDVHTFDLNNNTVTHHINNSTTTEKLELNKMSPTRKAQSNSTSTFWGTVKYNTYNDPFLGAINDSLKIYATNNGTVKGNYVINGDAYDSAASIIGYFVSYLVGFGIGVAAPEIANSIWGALITDGIVKVSGDIIKEKFTTTVTAQNTYYDTEAINPKISGSRTYEGSMHKIVSSGASFNQTFYEGYYPQFLSIKDNAVAYWMFSDFFGYDYPGVKSYN